MNAIVSACDRYPLKGIHGEGNRKRLRAMAFPDKSVTPETHQRESAIAAQEPDSMVRPPTIATPDSGELR